MLAAQQIGLYDIVLVNSPPLKLFNKTMIVVGYDRDSDNINTIKGYICQESLNSRRRYWFDTNEIIKVIQKYDVLTIVNNKNLGRWGKINAHLLT